MTINGRADRVLCQTFAFGIVLLGSSASNAADLHATASDPLKLVWSFSIPQKMTAKIESYHLVDGYVIAIGSDGLARCIRADTGEFMWNAQVGRQADKIWPPIAYHSGDLNAIGFATLDEAVFIDERSGFVAKRFELKTPVSGGLAAADKAILVTSVDRLVSRYDIKDGWPRWQIATRDVLSLPPVYLWGEDLVVTADESGRVTATAATRHRKYIIQLEGAPRGWMAVDSTTIYVATRDDSSLLHALDRRTGKLLREPYRIAGPPRGGPVVTARSVYQATLPSGLHRVGLTGEGSNWYHKNARMFLSEWPGRTAVLTVDGRIGLVDAQSGDAIPVVTSERYAAGVSNPYNDAIVVATDRGQIRCFRPAGASPLDVKTFRPATRPAETQPTEGLAQKPAKISPATILSPARPASARPAPVAKEPPAKVEAPRQPPPARAGQLPPNGQNTPMDRLREMLRNSVGPQDQNQPPGERPRY